MDGETVEGPPELQSSLPNPFIAKVLTMSPEQTVDHVPG